KLNTQHFIYRFSVQRMKDIVKKIHGHGLPVIADHKLADIGSSNSAAIYRIIERIGFDGITVHPVTGWKDGIDVMSSLVGRSGAGLFSVIYMSHRGAKDFYEREIGGKPLYKLFLEQALERNLTGVVVGATNTKRLDEISKMILQSKSNPVIMTVGYGKQGGELKEIPKSALQLNLLAFVGRSILYSYLSDKKVTFAESISNRAKEYRDILKGRIAGK
ncbi:MAG: orotidine 5'-phosphate decarboxylase / HUMPS family protein, partial [Nitrososphaerales archaeon]